ncbi:MAG: (d)CMP kinase [Gemmatimonadaceae bacterium]
MIIAIDGPAASGKSSTAAWVAERLGFRHIDSGALYRAATFAAMADGMPDQELSPARVLAASADIALAPDGGAFAPVRASHPFGEEIRGTEVTRHVSRVAAMPPVRDWVNDRVRDAAVGHDVVVDGRDIGTVVFPGADLKIFLVADPWERARRRLMQRLARRPLEEEIAAETELIVQRDARDATQTVQALDAVLIDTTSLTQAEQVDRIAALARARGAGITKGIWDQGSGIRKGE